jgi:hypothetical protein
MLALQSLTSMLLGILESFFPNREVNPNVQWSYFGRKVLYGYLYTGSTLQNAYYRTCKVLPKSTGRTPGCHFKIFDQTCPE